MIVTFLYYSVIGNALSRNPSSGQVVARINILASEGWGSRRFYFFALFFLLYLSLTHYFIKGNQEFWGYTHWSWSFKGSSCLEGMFSFLLFGFVRHQVRLLVKLRVWFMMYLVQNYECGIICRALYSHVKTLCMFIFLRWDSYG